MPATTSARALTTSRLLGLALSLALGLGLAGAPLTTPAAQAAPTSGQLGQTQLGGAVQTAELTRAERKKRKAKQRRVRARKARWAQIRKVRRAARVALAQRGDRYGYGAAGPNAFDCSGLIQYSYRRAGFRAIPRTSSAQARHTRRIPKGAMRPGDLMFFANGGGVYHAGIFVGRGRGGVPKMLHASRPGTPVKIDAPWTSRWFAGTVRRG